MLPGTLGKLTAIVTMIIGISLFVRLAQAIVRPYKVTFPCPQCGKEARRVPDVIDAWYDSGAMPFAQWGAPYKNKEIFERTYPAQYICEAQDQTRGWFYLLHVMATALFDRPAFKNVICHGIVLGSDGQKMSKHLRNYPDVNGVFNDFGSDAMRWFLMSSPILRGGNLIVTADGIRDTVRQVMLPVWSSYYFFTLYANAANGGAGFDARQLRADEVAGLPEMDRYLLARTRRLVLATGRDGADVVYDAVGGDYAEPALRAMDWNGRYLVVGFPAGIPSLPLNLTLLKSVSVIGVFWGAAVARDPKAHAVNMAELMQLWKDGKIKPLEELNKIALDLHPGATITKTELDNHFNGFEYEIELRDKQNVEWDVDIDAATGKVLKRELRDSWQKSPTE